MENGGGGGGENEKKEGASYRYWVRQTTSEAAPPPVPHKLSHDEMVNKQPQPPSLGSVWNRAGTWEEKNLHKWASDRIKELLLSLGILEFSGGKAEIKDVTKCVGDASLVTVRNKKRVGYTYELTLKVKGEWIFREETQTVTGNIEIPEFSMGELDELEMEVKLNDAKDLSHQDKQEIHKNLNQFLQPVREKLLQFEQELKDK